jgi:carboxyl-terminal processing protease
VGVAIEMVGDVVVVRQIVPGSPSEGANLQAGDRILGVDGERLRGLSLGEVVGRIRGEDGTKVELFVQRDTEEWDETLTRGHIVVQSVKAQMLEDGVGLLSIHSFAEKTAEEVEAHLKSLAAEGMTSLVLDLRECPGGLLESAVSTADLLLPPGETIVVLEKRGAEDDVRKAERETQWQKLPLIALVGPHTASGAEIVVEALAAADHGTIIGQPTLGKGTVESIHELDNGWALKLSVGRFHAEGSDRAVGEGVVPDILVSKGEGEGEGDAQLDAAVKMLKR